MILILIEIVPAKSIGGISCEVFEAPLFPEVVFKTINGYW
jgi:hypothetical protein